MRTEENKNSNIIREGQEGLNLDKIFNLGIERTLWKSVHLDKINELRKELHMPPRTEPLAARTYDKEVTDRLWQTDFSTQSVRENVSISISKCLKLGFCGIGFSVAPAVTETYNEDSHEAGLSGEHADYS